MWYVVTGFYLTPQLTSLFYLPLTTCHLDFVMRFFWKCCISNTTRKIFNFIKKKKKISTFCTLVEKKLTFSSGLWLTLPLTAEWSYFSLHFSSSSTKNYTTVTTNKSISTSKILFPHSLFYVSLIFLFVWSCGLINVLWISKSKSSLI